MFFYLSVIILSVLLFKLAEDYEDQRLLGAALVPPVLIEGLRDASIGTDMDTYVVPFFEMLETADSIFEVPKLIEHSDYGYLYLTYFCAKYIGNLNFFLTVCAILKLVPVYYVAYKLRNHLNATLFVSAYFLYYYVLGFSMMRQSIAISFSILSILFLIEGKYVKFSLLTLLAYYMHNSAILMIYLPLMVLIGTSKYRYIFSLALPFLIYFFISDIMEAFIFSPLFTEGKVEDYMNSGVPSDKTSLLICLTILLLGVYFFAEKYAFGRANPKPEDMDSSEGDCEDEKQTDDVFNSNNPIGMFFVAESSKIYILLSSIIFALVLNLLASYIEVAFRMAYYMLNVALLMALIVLKKKDNYLLYAGALSLFLLHFVIAAAHGLYETIPYNISSF